MMTLATPGTDCRAGTNWSLATWYSEASEPPVRPTFMIGNEFGSALLTRGSPGTGGNRLRMPAPRRSTASAAWFGSVPSASWTLTLELPSLEVEVMVTAPGMPATTFSIGWVTRSSMSWALAPVYVTLTLTNGMLIG